jgi:hypothetical protein
LVAHLGSRAVEEVDAQVVEAYLRSLADAGLKPRNHLRVVRRIVGWARRRGMTGVDALADINLDEGVAGKLRTSAVSPRRGPAQTQTEPAPSSPRPKASQEAAQPKPKWLVDAQIQAGLPKGWREFRLGAPVLRLADDLG